MELVEVRELAKSNGHQVSDRGPISATVQEAYDAAHQAFGRSNIAARLAELAGPSSASARALTSL